MIIENVEALRSWLTDKLRPICDADPSALAKYVVALIKKEKPMKELKDVCADQLDVFLSDETKKFVDELFDVLESKSYLPNNQLMIQQTVDVIQTKGIEESVSNKIDVTEIEEKSKSEETVEEAPSQPEVAEEYQKESETVPSDKEDPGISEEGNKKRRVSHRNNDAPSDRGYNRPHRHSKREKNFATMVDKFLNPRKPRNDSEGSTSRGRSMSPSSRRSPWGQSPGARRYRSRRERRRRSEERRSSRKRQRCRDYDEKGFCLLGNSCPFDHGRDPVVIDDAAIPNILNMQGLAGPALPLVQPSQPVPPQIPELFGGVFPSSMIANPVASMPANTLSLDTGLTLVSGQQRPLPSVAELPQSLPLLAQPQPALTTIQPVLEEEKKELRKDSAEKETTEASKSENGNEAYNPEEPSIGVIEQPVKRVAQRVSIANQVVSSSQPRLFSTHSQFPPTTITAEQFLQKMYTPSSALFPSHLPRAPKSNAVSSILQRSLMNLSSMQNLKAMNAPPQAALQTAPLAITSTLPVTTQPPIASPPRRPFMNQTILEIRKIPIESNTVVKLSEYFQKFGNIVNIQVNYDNDAQAALIQFASNAEARRAYSSPEAVLGNRFIKLFWHNKTKELPPMASQANMIATQNHLKSSASNDAAGNRTLEPPVSKPKLPATGQTTYVNPKNTPEALQKKQAEMKREVLKKKLEIQRQRRLLLEKQIKEQKVLITKLEKNKNMSSSEKQLVMTAIKTLTSSIEKLKTDLEAQAQASKPKSKQAIEKEILDREIELYNKQFTGEDLSSTKNPVTDLQTEALTQQATKPIAIGRGRGRGRGRGMPRGRRFSGGRAGNHGSRAVLDNRPKQVLVTGYEEKDKDTVVAQFASYGEIDRVEEKPGGKLVLSFHTRKQAEIASTKAAVFNGKPLILAWYSAVQHGKRSASSTSNDVPPAKIQTRESRRSSVSSLLDEDKDGADLLDDFDDKEADLLLLEEDEEEDEERSWKR